MSSICVIPASMSSSSILIPLILSSFFAVSMALRISWYFSSASSFISNIEDSLSFSCSTTLDLKSMVRTEFSLILISLSALDMLPMMIITKSRKKGSKIPAMNNATTFARTVLMKFFIKIKFKILQIYK